MELKKVPELQCEPGVSQECQDVEKRIPFIEDVEECEEIVFDDCIPVSTYIYTIPSETRIPCLWIQEI